MKDFFELLKTRRSIRKYENREVPQADLQKIFEAVQWSPSWANTQCWEIVAVKDRNVKEKLRATLPPKNPAAQAVQDAPVVIALCAGKNKSGYYKGEASTSFGDWLMFDLGLATQSLCLAACELGLGTVVVGMFDHKAAREILSVPDDHELMVLIPLGFPAHSSAAPNRRAVDEFVHWDRFK
ncbi:MAG: nitroreductase family protein [Desulfatiglandaceae bacterium]